ncbi:MAG: phage portal protein [Planctomycetota bacterium]
MSSSTKTPKRAKSSRSAPAKIGAVREKVRLSDHAASSPVRAHYDAVMNTTENANHWQYAGGQSAMALLTPAVRATARNRARYAVDNNGSIDGAVDRLANHIIGTGPRLQVMTKNREYNRRYQKAFTAWAKRIGLARKLRLAVRAQAIDGETLGVYFTNKPLRHKVKLDFQLIECDRLAAPFNATQNDGSDGIVFDDFGNPMAYQVLRHHPGGLEAATGYDVDTYTADRVFHLFHCRRIGQKRGLTQLVATLPLYEQLRRYRLSVLAAAETAADLAGVIKTQTSPDNPDELEPLDPVDIVRRTLLTLPMGWDISQLRAEQPTTGFSEFSDSISGECAQPLQMPFNVAQAKSAGYNFASAKIDLMIFAKANDIYTDDVEELVLEPLLEKWHEEASRIPGLIDGSNDRDTPPDHDWFWDVNDLLDPREAGSKATLISNGMMSYAEYYGDRGMDWQAEQEAQAQALGVTVEEYRALLRQKLFGSPEPEENESGEQEQENEDTATEGNHAEAA